MESPQLHLADFLPYQLSIASNAVSDAIAREYSEAFDLKITEWRIMAVLGDAGAQTQRALSARTVMDKVAVNRACKLMEDRGLARRIPNQDDGRSHHLELTQEGREMHAQIVPLARAMERRLFGSFDDAQQDQIRDLLRKLHRIATDLDREI